MYEEIVKKLSVKKKTIATMESCTGGAVVNAITNVEGASDVLKFSCITYANQFKVMMGVNKETIDLYSVYSIEVAREMSKSITNAAFSDYGVGVTGKLNCIDKKNPYGEDNIVFVSIYDKSNDKYYDEKIKIKDTDREKNKEEVVKYIGDVLNKIIN